MAGKSSKGFNGPSFRRNIRMVMNMGAPTASEDQATFVFPNQLVYDAATDDTDANGIPFDPSIPVRRHTPPSVKVPCAIEYYNVEGAVTDFGMVSASRAALTLLDEDYRKVKGCSAVLLGGERFNYQRTEAPTGLFDVGLYVMWFTAENDI